VVLFYLIWRIVRLFIKYFNLSRKTNPDISGNRESQSKYKNIEDAKYTEIKDEDKGKDKD
jgi:hypothetical protein